MGSKVCGKGNLMVHFCFEVAAEISLRRAAEIEMLREKLEAAEAMSPLSARQNASRANRSALSIRHMTFFVYRRTVFSFVAQGSIDRPSWT